MAAAPAAYHAFIGFRVAKPLLERAFSETYGIEMKDLFFSEDLAIGTYRHAVATTIPEMTKVAWGKKRDAIQKVIPGAKKEAVVFNLRRQQYEKEFGADYEKPHGFARVLALIYRLILKIGPFRAFSFSVPTLEAERLFLESFTTTREHFRQSLDALSEGHLHVINTNFAANVSENLRSDLVAFYGDADSLQTDAAAERKRSVRIRRQLAVLDSVKTPDP